MSVFSTFQKCYTNNDLSRDDIWIGRQSIGISFSNRSKWVSILLSRPCALSVRMLQGSPLIEFFEGLVSDILETLLEGLV